MGEEGVSTPGDTADPSRGMESLNELQRPDCFAGGIGGCCERDMVCAHSELLWAGGEVMVAWYSE